MNTTDELVNKVIKPKLTQEADALAAAMSKVTAELNKIDNIIIAGAANGGVIPDDMNPDDMLKGGMSDIDVVGREVFITPETEGAEAALDMLGDKATNAAIGLQDLYDKLTVSPPDEVLEAGAAYGLVSASDFTTENVGGEMEAQGDMLADGEVPLTDEEKIAEAQETEDVLSGIKEESADKDVALKAKEAEMAKKNMAGLIGMTKVGQKAMGAINSAAALKDAVTNVAVGITTAVKSAPFPANLPAIGFATAQGAASIATIKGQFHGGIDSVPENGTYLLEQGERVVDKRLNADLKGYLGTANGKAGDNVNIANTVTMQFSEGTTEDQVYEAKMKFEEMLRDMYDEYAIPNPFDPSY